MKTTTKLLSSPAHCRPLALSCLATARGRLQVPSSQGLLGGKSPKLKRSKKFLQTPGRLLLPHLFLRGNRRYNPLPLHQNYPTISSETVSRASTATCSKTSNKLNHSPAAQEIGGKFRSQEKRKLEPGQLFHIFSFLFSIFFLFFRFSPRPFFLLFAITFLSSFLALSLKLSSLAN